MRILLVVLSAIFANSLLAQQKHDSTLSIFIGGRFDIDGAKKAEFQLYIDSLNNYRRGRLPALVFDKCFDLHGIFWKDFHSPVSLRWDVLQKVNNKLALRALLNSKDKRLKEKCSYDSTPYPNLHIPMLDQSFYELTEKRYLQIK